MKKITLLLGLLLVSCEPVNDRLGLKDDNVAEEIAEEAIKAKTGLDLDLSPRSPE